MTGATLFRRASDLVLHWRHGRMVMVNYATRAEAEIDRGDLAVVEAADRWRTFAAMKTALGDPPEDELLPRLDRLVGETFVRSSAVPASERERAMPYWGGWAPAAAFFHQQTRREAEPEGHVEVEPEVIFHLRDRPPPLKRVAAEAWTPLPDFPTEGELPATLLGRRTWRRFGDDAVRLDQVSTLLGLTWAVQKWVVFDHEEVALKTSPSGGARHSIEVYLLANSVAGLAPGIHHYDPDRHRLGRIDDRHGEELTRKLLPQPDFAHADAVFFMTSIFARVQWRYQIPRAYRVVLMEVGHLAQTFLLVAEWLGLAPFCTAAIDDQATERLLGVDGVDEAVLYATGLGTRPAGTDWAFWPETRPAPETRPPQHQRRD